jgi:hypothetical protein
MARSSTILLRTTSSPSPAGVPALPPLQIGPDSPSNTDNIKQEKELPHPTVAHMLYGFLPLIDENNKARQNSLALEMHWLTKNCWTRILTTFLGMSVVDLQRWDRRMHFGRVSLIDLSMEVIGLENEDDDELVDDFDIKTMANLIGRPLTDGHFQYRAGCQPSTRSTTSSETNAKPIV